MTSPKVHPLVRVFLSCSLLLLPASVRATDDIHAQRAREMSRSAINWLRAQQDSATGGWAVPPQGPNFPAVTGLVISGMLEDR